MTVTENVALGLEKVAGPGRRRRAPARSKVVARIRELSDDYGLGIDPSRVVSQLSVGERQRVEILKALYRDASLLILDEPTAVLTPGEVDQLFGVLRGFVASGASIVFISHKLREVMALSDQVTVMRAGRVVAAEVDARTTTEGELARLMVGREFTGVKVSNGDESGEVRLRLRSLQASGGQAGCGVQGVDLDVRAGEILGIAGVSGNGQRELADAVAGLAPVDGGTVELDGEDVSRCDSTEMRARGLAYVPEERMVDGAIADFSVADNLMLVDMGSKEFSRWGFIKPRRVQRHCEELVRNFSIKTSSLSAPLRTLSGGNIQKVVMARELATRPKVLLAAQPTRGIDMGACEHIHQGLLNERGRGTAVLLISEDLDEVMMLSDRIAVMYEGEIVGVVDRGATRSDLGLMMAGVVPQPVPV